jgi:hypothetical protein
MKTFVMILVLLTIIGCSTTLNAQTRNQEYRSVVAVKVMDIWVEGWIVQNYEQKLVFRLATDEIEKLNIGPFVSVNRSSINMIRVRVRPEVPSNIPVNRRVVQMYEETNPSILDSKNNPFKRKRLTVTGIGLLVSGILSMVVAQGELDTDQFKAVQTILGASLGVAGVAALTLGELESEEYPQLELALLIHKQSVE